MFPFSVQTLADHIDQLDLALDQLAMQDRNFDRFALMLVDNVVELTLHQYAEGKNRDNQLWVKLGKPKYDQKAIAAAVGRHFDSKVKFARSTDFISQEVAESVQYLHEFRNTAYHQGRRHERILHSLALLYFRSACSVLKGCVPSSCSSRDQISHRAMKYLGDLKGLRWQEAFAPAWERLEQVASSMDDALASDLANDMAKAIEDVDSALAFVQENEPALTQKETTRDQIVVDAQVWGVAFTDKGKMFAAQNGCPDLRVSEYIEWMNSNYPLATRTDPVPRWRERVDLLRAERNPHSALKKYCEFMNQTEEVRDQIYGHASSLDEEIQSRIDAARGK